MRKFTLLSICFIVCTSLFAQPKQLKFERSVFSLNTSSYGGLLKDSDGFLWIGSIGKGVFRYDGHELINFTADPDRLSGAMINGIVEDKSGVIWIGTFSNGVTRYDKETAKFSHFKHDSSNVNSISSDNLPFNSQALFVDREDNLWVGTDGHGLNRFDKKTETWTRFKHNPTDANGLSNNTVMAIIEDHLGNIWIGTKNGLNQFNPQSQQWTQYRHDAKDRRGLSSNWVNTLLEDREGVIWVGTKDGGLNRFHRESETFMSYLHNSNDPDSLSSNQIWNLSEGAKGNIWVCYTGTAHSGVDLFDRKRNIFVAYSHDDKNTSSISSNNVASVFENLETGIVWFVNGNGIVDKYDKKTKKFQVWQHNPKNPNSLGSNTILPILEDNEGFIWVGSTDGGLSRLDRTNETFKRYIPNPKDPTSIPNLHITALFQDSKHKFWVGNWGGTLCNFDRQAGKCKKIYRHSKINRHGITNSQRLKFITEDKDNPDILWIGTFGGGLDRFDKTTEIFTHFKKNDDNPKSLSNDIVVMIFDDGKGNLYIPTYGGGLNIMNKATGDFTLFKNDPKDPKSINSNTLYEVFVDSSGTMWISGKGGISRFDEQNQTFKTFSRMSGFPSDIIDNILEDNQGNLWLGTTDTGLVKFNPGKETFKVYSTSDGLPSNTFFWTSRLKSKDGTLWFGGGNGVVSFHPEKITINKLVPPIVLTSLRQSSVELNFGHAPERIKEITLPWKANYFEFKFAALNYTQPEKNQYAYKLEGRDLDWYYSGNDPFGRYTGLQGGEYTLRLKGSNNDGIWNEKGIAIKIKVLAPFWKAPWFMVVLFILVILIIFTVISYFKRLKEEIKERKQAEEALQKYKLLFSQTNDLAYICDSKGNIIYLNKAFEKLSGQKVKESIGKTFGNLFDDENLKIATEVYSKTLQGKSPEYELRFMNTGKLLEYKNTPVRDEKGDIVGVMGIARDITERRHGEEELKSTLKEKETLLHEIHHRVKNNMQVINSLLKLQANNVDDKQIKEILKDSQSRVYAMSAVHETLHGSEKLSEIDLKSYLSKITTSIFQTYSIDHRKVKLKSSVENSPISLNQAYPLGLIVNELISNSLKYAFPDERNGEISVSMNKQDKELELIIKDDGVGIPKDFDWKNSNTLGLKLIRSLVENQLDGSIDMGSKNGTKFTIKFNINSV